MIFQIFMIHFCCFCNDLNCFSFVHSPIYNPSYIRKGNVHAATLNIPFSWLIFPLSANLQHLCLDNIRFFCCLPTSSTYVWIRSQILGVNPPLIHSFSNYILQYNIIKCNYILCKNVQIIPFFPFLFNYPKIFLCSPKISLFVSLYRTVWNK